MSKLDDIGPESLLQAELDALEAVQKESAATRGALLSTKMDQSTSMLKFMLAQQVEKEKRDAENRRFYVRYVIGPLITALLAGVGYTGFTSGGTAEKVEETTEQVREDLQKQIGSLDRHIRANDIKYDENLEYQLRRDVAVQETLDHVSKKLDAVSRRAAAVEPTPGVRRAREAARAIREAEAEDVPVDITNLYTDE